MSLVYDIFEILASETFEESNALFYLVKRYCE